MSSNPPSVQQESSSNLAANALPAPQPAAQNISAWQILRQRNFAFYLSARILATLAVQMQSVAVGWQVYQLTGNVFDLGLIGLAQFAPFLLLILWAGHSADRYPRKNIILLCFASQMLCALLLLAFTWSGSRVVWPVFMVLVLFGSARAFMMPATAAILVNLVPQENMGRAMAISSTSFHVAVICGPALGGFLYLAGPLVVYTVVASLLLCALLLLSRVKPQGQAIKREPATWSTVLEGIHFVRSRPVLLGGMSLDLFAVLFGGVTALLPAYAHDVLQTGPTGLGLLRAMPGAGAALTSIWLAAHPIERRVGAAMFAGVAAFGLCTLAIGLTSTIWIAAPALFILGAGDMISVYVRHMLVQLETPDEIRGRVSAVNAVFIGASNELGEFESGLTAGWFGLVPAIIFGGVATLVVTGLWIKLFPQLAKMDRFPQARK